MGALTPPSYVANANVVLVPPNDLKDPESNRFLGLGGLDQSAAVLERSMRSAGTRAALEKAAPGAAYAVLSDPTTSAPVLNVTASGRQEKATRAMLQAALRQVRVNLRDLQSEVSTPLKNQIVVLELSSDPTPQASLKPRVRAVGASFVGLLVLGFLVIGAIDGLLVRRSEPPAEGASGPHPLPGERRPPPAGGPVGRAPGITPTPPRRRPPPRRTGGEHGPAAAAGE